MFDSDISHYLTDRTVDGADQIYIGLDNKTGKPMLAIPGVQKALIGAYYYELTEAEYEEAKADLPDWYSRTKSSLQQAAA